MSWNKLFLSDDWFFVNSSAAMING